MKLGEPTGGKEDPLSLKSRVMNLAPLHEIPKRRRGDAAETLVKYQLLMYGDVKRTLRGAHFVGDRICLVEQESGTARRVPIEIKSVPITRHRRLVKVGKNFLREFSGVYVVIVQRREPPTEYDFLVLMSDEMRREIVNRGFEGTHDKSHREKRWHLKIPEDFKGFEAYIDSWEKLIDYEKNLV